MNLFLLTCANEKEAKEIALKLLEKNLVVCTKRLPVSSAFYWEGNVDQDEEVLLILESEDSLFEKVDKEVKKIHSYEQYVLVSLPVSKMGAGVEKWLKEGLKK